MTITSSNRQQRPNAVLVATKGASNVSWGLDSGFGLAGMSTAAQLRTIAGLRVAALAQCSLRAQIPLCEAESILILDQAPTGMQRKEKIWDISFAFVLVCNATPNHPMGTNLPPDVSCSSRPRQSSTSKRGT